MGSFMPMLNADEPGRQPEPATLLEGGQRTTVYVVGVKDVKLVVREIDGGWKSRFVMP